jgi:rubrerythrin
MSKIAFTVFNFDTEADAIQFYLEMNENITHSPEDISKARTILTNLKGESK